MLLRTVALVVVAVLSVESGGQSSIGSDRIALQERVDALAQQLQLRYGGSATGLARRRQAVQAVLIDWNRATSGVSARSESLSTNLDLMEQWLDDALAAAMPGGSGRIPMAPLFVDPPIDAAPIEVVAAPNESANAAARRSTQSFVDDTQREIEDAPSPAAMARDAPTGPIFGSPVAPQPAAKPTRRKPIEEATPRVRQPSFLEPSRQTVAKPVTEPEADAAPLPDAPTPARSKWSRHPAAAPLKWRDPFNDDPNASPNPLRQGARRSTGPAIGSPSAVQVNLTALAAEVRGYNAAYRELQAALDQLTSADSRGLTKFVRRFESLEQRGDFIQLYIASVPQRERRGLPAIASQSVLRELIRREAELLRNGTRPQQRAAARLLASIDAYASRD